MTRTSLAPDTPYLRACNGRLTGVLRWPDLDALWAQLQRCNDGRWYVYAVGEPPPAAPSSPDQFERSLAEIRQRLLDEHKEDYCGIVYADDLAEPGFVKIFDPGNLGAVCGFSEHPPLPGWTLSRVAPDDLTRASSPPRGRNRWWRRIFR
jgi:hypothetical protein